MYSLSSKYVFFVPVKTSENPYFSVNWFNDSFPLQTPIRHISYRRVTKDQKREDLYTKARRV